MLELQYKLVINYFLTLMVESFRRLQLLVHEIV
jgi:hypothetical protein